MFTLQNLRRAGAESLKIEADILVAALFSVGIFAETTNSVASSAFVANDSTVAFALNIPNESDNELYFSLSGPSSSSYIVSSSFPFSSLKTDIC
jgi:hypothetical protein